MSFQGQQQQQQLHSQHWPSPAQPPQPLHTRQLKSEATASPQSSSIAIRDMPQYTSREGGDPSQVKKNKQTMADLKLRRLTELNNRLREDFDRERIPISTAAKSIIAYCTNTKDYMVPSVWNAVPKGEDPYAPQQSGGCCLVM